MRFEIIVAPDAVASIRRLDARIRSEVTDHIEAHLRHEPRKVSKSRIKRLRGLRQPQYRLRVGEIRVFYDVIENDVHVLAVVAKSRASEWLNDKGIKE
jgi:mRNA-degrading endonuclease RelE of RelBE toxin-antitoxin system